MIIKRKHPFTLEINERDLNVTIEQIEAFHTGTLAQDAFPQLSPEDREFIMTGITDSCVGEE